jgi:hypothetical protein
MGIEVRPVSSDVAEKPNDDGSELDRLRHQVVAQARELALLRWEISSLTRRSVDGGIPATVIRNLQRYAKLAQTISRMHAATRDVMSALRPRHSSSKIPSGKADPWPATREPALVIGDSPMMRQIAANSAPGKSVFVSSGAGSTRSLPVQRIDEPPLRPPAPGSLVNWLIEDPSRLRRLGTIIADADDELSLGLLRGRLVDGQVLALISEAKEPPLENAAVVELGQPSLNVPGFRAYRDLPGPWLDPLDEHNRPIPAIVSRQSWPKISVVMVSYNQASFVDEGLRSVLDQGYPNLEFIVVDGNSTDGSIDILNRYRDRVSAMIVEPDRGQSDGLNKGFARTTGDILTWVNSDDLLEPGSLFRVAQAFSTYRTDMVAGGCRQIGLTREVMLSSHHNRLPYGISTMLPLGLLLEMDRFWLTGNFFYQPEVFFSRGIWSRSGGRLRMDLNYVLDYDLWVRMAAAGATIAHIPDFLASSRTHDQQKTTVGFPQMPEVQWLLREYGSRLASPPPHSA